MTAIYPDLAGKVVLVTGGASGIGAAIARVFARQKSTVVFFDINEEAGMGLSRELSGQGLAAYFQRVDLTDIPALRAGVADACKAHGPTVILINNAAHDERHPTEEVTPEYWDDRIAVNLKHQFFAAQAVLPSMKAAGQGVIINFGSTSWMVGQGGMAAYTASKSGVIGLTRSLARLRPLQHPGECDRARVDHDRAPDRKMADARRRSRTDAPPMPEAEAHPGRTRELHGLPRFRRRLGLHRAALCRGWRLGVNAPRSTSTSRRQFGIHRAVAIQRPPAALERKAASTITTQAKPSSMVGKVTAGSMEEPVRRAMMHAALALLAESLWAMPEPAEPPPTMILSYTLAFPFVLC